MTNPLDPTQVNDALLGPTHKLVGDGKVKRLERIYDGVEYRGLTREYVARVVDVDAEDELERVSLWQMVRQWWGRV